MHKILETSILFHFLVYFIVFYNILFKLIINKMKIY